MSRSKLLKEFGFKEENVELLPQQHQSTGFPKSQKSYRLTYEVYDLSIEEPYFWVLDTLKDSFPIVEKLEDSFAAAENSAFFGVTQQRLGAQQDKATQFLVAVGKMVKELFQIVRELRILDERIHYYDQVDGNKEKGITGEIKKPINERKKSANMTLKGFFVDLVQGGGKSPASVYGMARELEFVTLPDLFFDAPPFKTRDELDNHIDHLRKDFNENVLRVLTRHLSQYMQWRTQTGKEHRDRKNFMLKYLEQHYQVIQMYINWLRPYLRNVNRLSMKSKNMDSADLISAFEGSMLDIEVLARKNSGSLKVDEETKINLWECLLINFNYRTRAEMKVVQEGYQRGPVHIGKVEMNIRVYRWTDEDVENYKKLKQKEDIELLGGISGSVQAAIESLGDELSKYLKEAKGKKEEKSQDIEKPKDGLMKKFFGDFYHKEDKKQERKKRIKALMTEKEVNSAINKFKGIIPGHAMAHSWLVYNNFKKSHRMITW